MVSVAVHAALGVALLASAGDPLGPAAVQRESVISTALRYLLPPDRSGRAGDEVQAKWSSRQVGALPSENPEAYSAATQPAGAPRPDPEDSAAPEPLAEAAAAQHAFTLLDVDTAAVRDPASAVPAYPPLLERQGIEGIAIVRFVVDSTGLADLSTFRLIETNHPLFGVAVRDALPGMKFHPATVGPKKVRQLVELPFGFRIVRRGAADPARRPQI